MNPEIKAQWVAALRSGEYEQTTGVLHKINADGSEGFCCLGVLSKIAADAGVVEPRQVSWHGDQTIVEYGSLTRGTGTGANAILGHEVRDWSGLDSDTGWLDRPIFTWTDDEGDEQDAYGLASANDAGATFEQIATIIEENL